MWADYAESIGVVPSPAIEWFYVMAIVASALVVANLVALVVAPMVARHRARAPRTE